MENIFVLLVYYPFIHSWSRCACLIKLTFYFVVFSKCSETSPTSAAWTWITWQSPLQLTTALSNRSIFNIKKTCSMMKMVSIFVHSFRILFVIKSVGVLSCTQTVNFQAELWNGPIFIPFNCRITSFKYCLKRFRLATVSFFSAF